MRDRALIIYGRPGSGKTSIKAKLEAAFGEEVIDEWSPRQPLPAGRIVLTQSEPKDFLHLLAFHDGIAVRHHAVDALPISVVKILFGV